MSEVKSTSPVLTNSGSNILNLCSHKICSKEIHTADSYSFSYCEKCAVMILNKDGLQVPGIKPKDRRFIQEMEVNDCMKMMKAQTAAFLREEIKSNYLSVRKKVISLLKELFRKHHQFSEGTFYLTLEYLDRILGPIEQVNIISDAKLELLIIGSFLLAVKFAENDPIVPDLSRLSITHNEYYDVKDVRKYENHCIKFLDYKLDFFTSYDVLNSFINIGLFFNDEINQDFPTEKIFAYAHKLLNHFVLNNMSLKFTCMQIGLSILYLTRERFKLDEERTNFLLIFYGFNKDYFMECMTIIKIEEISKMNLITPFVRERDKSHTTKVMVNISAVQEKLKIKLEEAENEKNKNMNMLAKSVSAQSSYLSIHNNLKKIDSARSDHQSTKSSKSNSIDKNRKTSGKLKLKLTNTKGIVLGVSSASHSNASTSSNVSSKSLNKYPCYSSNRSKDNTLILPKIIVNSKCEIENSLNKSTNFNKLSSFYNSSKLNSNKNFEDKNSK